MPHTSLACCAGVGYSSTARKRKPVEIAMEDKEMKQRSNSAYSFAIKDGKLIWSYDGIGSLSFDPTKASATNRARAIVHGFKQRIIDAAAKDTDKATGKTDP